MRDYYCRALAVKQKHSYCRVLPDCLEYRYTVSLHNTLYQTSAKHIDMFSDRSITFMIRTSHRFANLAPSWIVTAVCVYGIVPIQTP